MPSFHLTENITYDLWDYGDFLRRTSTWAAKNARAQLDYTSKSDRRIAGSKRVEKYRLNQANKAGDGLMFQSITALPELQDSSFEELRVEYYRQSSIAEGQPSSSVNPVKTPSAAIPPVFEAYKVDEEKDEDRLLVQDVIMKD